VRNAYKILVRNPEGKKPFGRCRRRWEDTELKETGCGGVDWIQPAQHKAQLWAIVNTTMDISSSIKAENGLLKDSTYRVG
jgi:hypothetical protein